MKKIFLSAFFICSVVIISSAQFSAGIKAGGNFTNVLTSDKTAGHKYLPGFHLGAILEMDVSEFISFQAEVDYSKKGFLKQNSIVQNAILKTTTDTKLKYAISYIDVPLLLNIHFGQMGSYIGIGPQVSFLAGVKTDGTIITTTSPIAANTGTTVITPVTTTTKIADNNKTGYSKVDFGAVIGTGSKFVSGIEYCLRAGYGFANVIDPTVSLSNDVWHNLVFSVSLGYTFHFGGGQGDRYGHKYNKPKKRRH
jgi:hypothetical protein